MGVSGLWDSVAAAGKVIHPKILENKTLAIDGTFWIAFVYASRENIKYNDDFLSVFFKRLCMLLSYKIHPIIVFDGVPPEAKQAELNKRAQINSKYSKEHKDMALKRIARQAVFKQLLSTKKNDSNKNDDIEYETDDDQTIPQSTQPTPISLFTQSSDDESIDYDEYFNEDSVINEDKFNELPLIEKFKTLKKLQDKSYDTDKAYLLNFKGSISDFSDEQVKIYMKNVSIVKLLEKVKRELSVADPPLHMENIPVQMPDNEVHNVWLDSSEIIKNYNTLLPKSATKRRKYLNDLDAMHESYQMIKRSDHNQEKEEDVVIFANDSELFGDEFMQGEEDTTTTPNFALKTSISPTPLNQPLDLEESDSLDEYTQCPEDAEPESFYSIEDSLTTPNDPESEDEWEEPEYAEVELSIPPEPEYLKVTNHDIKPRENEWTTNYPEKSLNTVNRYSKIITYEEFDNLCALIKLFNIPIIFAPTEAEAQCAQLNIEGLVYGVISDDSDTLVYGATRVIKNFFNSRKSIQLYHSENIKNILGLTREKLILIAILCGCDYTNGIKGVGIVNALEILEAYPTFEDLYEFREWATNINSNTDDPLEVRRNYKIKHDKVRNGWIFYSDFPNIHAYNLLKTPKVDVNIEITKPNKFSKLDAKRIESIALFMEQKSRLTPEEIVGHLNELNRCLTSNLLNGQLRLYDLDNIRFDNKSLKDAPGLTPSPTDTTCAVIRSVRMKNSIKNFKSNSNYVT